MKVMK